MDAAVTLRREAPLAPVADGACGEPVLRVAGLQVVRGGHLLLGGVSLSVAAGSVVALVGPNGAGKSTLLRAVGGEWPAAGQVEIGGRALQAWPRRELARRMAVMSQHTQLDFDFTVEEVVALGRLPHRGAGAAADAAVVGAVMATLDLLRYARRSYLSLSGGERQRVQFARVLAQLWEQPAGALLLLDEPTAALDLAQQRSVLGRARDLAGRGAGVLAVLHDLNLAAAYADRLVVLRGGRVLAEGTPSECLTPAIVSEAFGVPVDPLLCRREPRPVVLVLR